MAEGIQNTVAGGACGRTAAVIESRLDNAFRYALSMPSMRSEEPINGRHFGVLVRPGKIHGLRVDRTTYTNVSRTVSDSSLYLWAIEKGNLSRDEAAEKFEDPETCKVWREDYAASCVELALRNFDLNMMAFARIDEQRFQEALDGLLGEFPEFQPVTDLTEWMDRNGLYIMVLDQYRQVYVGQSVSIGKRVRQHWSSSKRLDRLIFGSAEGSILPIDSFRALDTTRIYAWSDGLSAQCKRDSVENKVVAHMDPELSLNRIAGGEGHAAIGESDREGGLKQRVLEATDEEWSEYLARLDETPMGREVHPRGWRRNPPVRKRTALPEITDTDSDPVTILVAEANRRERGSTILVDAGGTVIEICDGAVPLAADKYIQLFAVPCGRSISREKIEQALGNCRAFMGAKSMPPIPLFDLHDSSGVSVRVPR